VRRDTPAKQREKDDGNLHESHGGSSP
jgi:hypothetical protein